MLDRILKNALVGVTVIEEETGSVARILARQMAGFAAREGRRVVSLSFGTEERPILERRASSVGGASNEDDMKLVGKALNLGGGQRAHIVDVELEVDNSDEAYGAKRSFLERLDGDFIIIDSFSTYLYNKSDAEAEQMIREVARVSKREGKTFVMTCNRGLMSERTMAFIEAMADSVIVIKTELTSDRVTRMIYVPKMRDSPPLDRLIKITIDESGLQVDTREFVG